jgi:membrane fusion protein, multidrug efflux system
MTMDEQQTGATKSPAVAGGENAGSETDRPTFWKRRPVIVVGTLGLAWLLFLGLHYVARSFTHESTDDAFLSADIGSIAPRVAGQVKRVCVNDNQPVKAGEMLVEIDPRDYAVQVAQKQAALKAAEANVKLLEASIQLLGTQVGTAQATAKKSEAEAAADQANADRAEADLKRAEGLIQNRTISPQEFDAAKAAAASATATLKAGQEKAVSDRTKIDETRAQLEAGRRAWERAQAQASQSGVDVQQADLNLSYTRVTAPQDGRVTRKAVQDGDYVQAGQRLMALVSGEIYVVANFKETELRGIRPGQPVKITVDSVGGHAFAGHVDSIQAGSGAAFSLLPPENAVGNYVKVVQRVPVKILFDQPIEAGHVLGPGMSVVPSVQVAGFEVPDFVIAIVAAILALIAGFAWSKAANRQAPAAA